MRSEKARGFVLDFADVEALNNELEPADAMAVIVALSRYAKEGRRPEKGELCPAASMAFTLMVRNVDRGLENLKKRTESTRNAANARWHPQSAAGKQTYADGEGNGAAGRNQRCAQAYGHCQGCRYSGNAL